jgi:hypothetical protein
MADRPTTSIDSRTVGDPDRFRALDDLERGLKDVRRAPKDRGRVTLVVRRGQEGAREIVDRAEIAPDLGIPGDAWGRRAERNLEMQIAVMETPIAELIANSQPLVLFGDGLFLDLDLSAENLPRGTHVGIGSATLEVTPMPHNGCLKFSSRFGPEALRFVNKPELRHRNLRGIYMRVIEAGEIRPGDRVRVVTRGGAAPAARGGRPVH